VTGRSIYPRALRVAVVAICVVAAAVFILLAIFRGSAR
jgi:hypothetical protein